MFNILKNKSKGSYTIEAVIVMSSVLMAIFAVFYSFTLIYQNVVIMYAASYGAQQGAMAWENTGIDIDGKSREYNEALYDRILEIGGGGHMSEKKNNIEQCVREKLKMGIFNVNKINVKVDVNNNILQRKITVEVSQDVPIPLSGIVKYFGGDTMMLHAKTSAVIDDPAEYIRNLDYVMEWVKRGMEKAEETEFGSKLSDAVNAVTKWIG